MSTSYVNADLHKVIVNDEADSEPWNRLTVAAIRVQNVWSSRAMMKPTHDWNTSKWYIYQGMESIEHWLTIEETAIQRQVEEHDKKRKREEPELDQDQLVVAEDNLKYDQELALRPSCKKKPKTRPTHASTHLRKEAKPPLCAPPTHLRKEVTHVWDDDEGTEEERDAASRRKPKGYWTSRCHGPSGEPYDDWKANWTNQEQENFDDWKANSTNEEQETEEDEAWKDNWTKDRAPWKTNSTDKGVRLIRRPKPVGENRTAKDDDDHCEPYWNNDGKLVGDRYSVVGSLVQPNLVEKQHQFIAKWAQGPQWDCQNNFAHGYRIHLRDLPVDWKAPYIVTKLKKDATELSGTPFLGPMHSWTALAPSESTVQSILTFNTATEAAVAFQACWKWNHSETGTMIHVNVSWCTYAPRSV